MRRPRPRARWIGILALALAPACSTPQGTPAAGGRAGVEAEVHALLASVASDLEAEGPRAWLRYFSGGAEFSMASEGVLQFPDLATAERFVDEFAPQVAHMELAFEDVRVDPLEGPFVEVGARYREVLVDAEGRARPMRGYMTGLLEATPEGLRFRHLHWSELRTPEP